MKKQIRNITIGGKTYNWAATLHDDEGLDYTKLRIWKSKRELIAEVHYEGVRAVTPFMVAKVIEVYVS
jgi:hypothetical protein